MIVRARSVVTMDGPPLENGAVAVSGDVISDVGTYADVRARNGGEVLDLGERVLLPGLINAHCHLDYTGMRGSIPRPASFSQWIRAINERKSAFTAEDYLRSIASGFAEAASFGTTTLVNLEAFPELLSQACGAPLRTWWFAEMIDIREPVSPGNVYARMREDLSACCRPLHRIGLAPHAPFTASAKLYRAAAAVASEHDLPLTTHLSESHAEMQMFAEGTGDLFDFVKSLGRSMDDCGEQTPLARMLELGLLNERWLVAHLNELTDGDFRPLEHAPKFHVVHCARSHAYFRHTAFPLERLQKIGFNISLGTDSLASNGDLSLFAEMRHLSDTMPTLSPHDLLEMVTTRPARALRQGDALGRLKRGFRADLIAVASRSTGSRLFEEILEFVEKVPWSMVNGVQLNGE